MIFCKIFAVLMAPFLFASSTKCSEPSTYNQELVPALPKVSFGSYKLFHPLPQENYYKIFVRYDALACWTLTAAHRNVMSPDERIFMFIIIFDLIFIFFVHFPNLFGYRWVSEIAKPRDIFLTLGTTPTDFETCFPFFIAIYNLIEILLDDIRQNVRLNNFGHSINFNFC